MAKLASLQNPHYCLISLNSCWVGLESAKMATTLVSHIPPIKCSSSISTPSSPHNKHHQAIKPCCSKPIINNYIQHLSKPTESSAFSRREAIGFGLCLNFFDTLLPASAAAESNTAAACEFTVADSGLAFCDKVVGYGSQAEKGQLIKAHYVGKLVSGKVFDSSYNRGKPLTFRIGVGEVIKGWDQGILGGDGVPPMLAGGKRTLKLPPQLGYGMRGAGCKGGSCIIPPDSVLLFDVEFIGKA